MNVQKREGANPQKWAESFQGGACEVVPALWAWRPAVKDFEGTLSVRHCVFCGYFFCSPSAFGVLFHISGLFQGCGGNQE